MPMPMTTWPGHQGGYAAPAHAFGAGMQRQPMFAGDAGPRYTGPFNLNIGQGQNPGMGLAMQMMLPQVMGSLMGPGKMPAQFVPEQNLYDQMKASEYFQGSQEAMSLGSHGDVGNIDKFLSGISMMKSGEKLTDEEKARNHRMAQGFSKALPILSQIMGPEMIDTMMGGRSSTVMSQQVHQAMRTAVDPLTGATGMSGRSAGIVSNEIFENLYGEDADISEMKGMNAGSAGVLTDELQARGLLGPRIGMMGDEERADTIRDAGIDDRTVNRLANRMAEQTRQREIPREATREALMEKMAPQAEVGTEFRAYTDALTGDQKEFEFAGQTRNMDDITEREVREMMTRDAGMEAADVDEVFGRSRRKVSEDDIEAERRNVRSSFGKMTEAGAAMTDEEIEALPGGEDIVRSTDAQRISGKLKNMSGAVKAMRDIFGDMGNPNAPMREIINGLEALTQGGMATMSPGSLEAMVRKTHTLAKQTGVGMQGMMSMIAQNAPLADRLGLDRSFAVTSAQGAAAFGQAAGDTLNLDQPAWGAMTKEQLTLADSQLRMHAAASAGSNQMNAVMRMRDRGMFEEGKSEELDAYVAAIEAGETEYTVDGETRHVGDMTNSGIAKMMEDAGVNRARSQSVMMDLHGNQEFGLKYGTEKISRKAMGREMAHQGIAGAVGLTIRNDMATKDDAGESVISDLIAAGVIDDEDDFLKMSHMISQGVSEDLIEMDSSIKGGDRAKAVGESMRERFAEALRTRQPGMPEAQVEKLTDQMVERMGGEKGMAAAGEAGISRANAALRGRGIASNVEQARALFNQETLEAGEANEREAEADATMQSALSGLGTAGPIERMVRAIQNADEGTTLQDLGSELMGAVSVEEIAKRAPDGPVAQMMGLLEENRTLDPKGSRADLKKFKKNAAIVEAMIAGGDKAKDMAATLEEEGFDNKKVLEQLKSGEGIGKQWEDLSRVEVKRRADVKDARAAEAAGGDLTKEQARLLDEDDKKGVDGKGADAGDQARVDGGGDVTRKTRDAAAEGGGGAGDQDRALAITLTGGNLTIHDDGQADIRADGKGIMSEILNAVGLS